MICLPLWFIDLTDWIEMVPFWDWFDSDAENVLFMSTLDRRVHFIFVIKLVPREQTIA